MESCHGAEGTAWVRAPGWLPGCFCGLNQLLALWMAVMGVWVRSGRQHRHRVFLLLHDCSTRFLGLETALHRSELSQPMPRLLPAVLVLE